MLASLEKKFENKMQLHQRNKHRSVYDFDKLIELEPDLKKFVLENKYKDTSLDFFNPVAVKLLNKSLLKMFYGIKWWDIPDGYLTPPIPGRADYIHYLADLLRDTFQNDKAKIPKGNKINCLDIGTGANCIYPIIGISEYNWNFIASDLDEVALSSAEKILEGNINLKGKLQFRLQADKTKYFEGIINPDEFYDLTICNPPFHSSAEDALRATTRKSRNLKGKKEKPVLNFGGKNTELWYEGGEKVFVENMILESVRFSRNCLWFTTLVSKRSNIEKFTKILKNNDIADYKIIKMAQGNKTSHILAWTFLNSNKRNKWAKAKW